MELRRAEPRGGRAVDHSISIKQWRECIDLQWDIGSKSISIGPQGTGSSSSGNQRMLQSLSLNGLMSEAMTAFTTKEVEEEVEEAQSDEAKVTRGDLVKHMGKHRIHRTLATAFFWVVPLAVEQATADVEFPASLMCMIVLSALLLTLEACGKGSWAQFIFAILQPGQHFLVKWTAVFFLPALVQMPVELEGSVSGGDMARLVVLIIVGWLIHFTVLLGLSFLLIQAVRKLTNTGTDSQEPEEPPQASEIMEPEELVSPSINSLGRDSLASPLPEQKLEQLPLERELNLPTPRWPVNLDFLLVWGSVMIAGAIVGHSSPLLSECMFLISACIIGTTIAGLCPAHIKLILAPVLVALVFTFAAVGLWSLRIGSGFLSICGRFNSGDVMRPHEGVGAGRILMSFMPAFVVSLSLVIYKQREVLWQNMSVITGTSICGVFLGLFGQSAIVNVLGLPANLARPSGVRFFTAPLAMQSAEALGTSTAMAASYAVASGLVGASIGWPWVSKVCRVENKLIYGCCIGGASHGQGTALLASFDPEATAYSSVSFILTGVIGALLVRVPFVQERVIGITG